jgi:hypothetical protein
MGMPHPSCPYHSLVELAGDNSREAESVSSTRLVTEDPEATEVPEAEPASIMQSKTATSKSSYEALFSGSCVFSESAPGALGVVT